MITSWAVPRGQAVAAVGAGDEAVLFQDGEAAAGVAAGDACDGGELLRGAGCARRDGVEDAGLQGVEDVLGTLLAMDGFGELAQAADLLDDLVDAGDQDGAGGAQLQVAAD